MPGKLFFAAILLLCAPLTASALEQSFMQNGLKAAIKLSPDELVVGQNVNLALKLERVGQTLTDRKVTLEIYEREATEPTIRRVIDLLDDEYIDSWSFENPGDYKVVVSIADPQKPGEALHYEVKASVGEAKDASQNSHEEHSFFSRHFGGKWGWWGAGLMILIMAPMVIIGL